MYGILKFFKDALNSAVFLYEKIGMNWKLLQTRFIGAESCFILFLFCFTQIKLKLYLYKTENFQTAPRMKIRINDNLDVANAFRL